MRSPVLVLAYYLHDLSPFIVRFSENFGLRWYGLAYVLAFLIGFLILREFARRGMSELRPEQVGDFITWVALVGVMLGGRLGYMLLYDREAFFANPLRFFDLLGGGMASHGGILGVTLFALYYARRHRLSWLGLGDDLVVVVPIGLLLGRIANFINGELYGHITTGIPWAVQFPTELRDAGYQLASRVQQALPSLTPFPEAVIEAGRTDPVIQQSLRQLLPLRHPSQLYEALLEGAVLFAILLAVRLRWKELRHGVLTGLFFILYALLRILSETWRVPDHALILGLNPGQFYSLFMIAIGAAFLLASRRGARPAPRV
ncbi:MAG: prolipoprotein diacylglyceryl transferase [Verrucomicrobiales bacterium]